MCVRAYACACVHACVSVCARVCACVCLASRQSQQCCPLTLDTSTHSNCPHLRAPETRPEAPSRALDHRLVPPRLAPGRLRQRAPSCCTYSYIVPSRLEPATGSGPRTAMKPATPHHVLSRAPRGSTVRLARSMPEASSTPAWEEMAPICLTYALIAPPPPSSWRTWPRMTC